jgi:DNA polymerase-1
VLIDGSSVLYRAFFALPPFINSKGLRTNAAYGFTMMLFKMLEDYKPDYIAVAFDVKAPTFRHKEYDAYKATRERMPDELASQIPIVNDILSALNIKTVEVPGFEADDILGTMSKVAEEQGYETYIVTGDRDALQLVSDNTKVVLNKKGMTNVDVYDMDYFKEKYGITPTEFIDLKGLMGDQSDNVPGVPGVGKKTAMKLIKEYSSINNVINNLDSMKNKRIKNLLTENMDKALLSKRLCTIVRDLPVKFDMNEYALTQPDGEKIREIFETLEFKSLLDKIPAKDTTVEIKKAVYDRIDNRDDFGRYTEGLKSVTISYRIEGGNLIMAALSSRNGAVFLPLYKTDKFKAKDLYRLLADGNVEKSGHDLKNLLNLCIYNGYMPENICFDSAIAAYLLNATKSEYTVKQIAKDFLSRNILDDSILGKGKNKLSFNEVDEDTLNQLVCDEAEAIRSAQPAMAERLSELGMDRLFNDIEMPLITVLADMECTGFNIDRQGLARLDKEFTEHLEGVTEDIYRMAGEKFNINSPKQLSHILFEKLELPVIKKTKTGYSTNAEVLAELAPKNEIVAKILDYRQDAKLKSTYIDGFVKLIEKNDEKIHTSFKQTVTATGRISSTEPNLQNIPIRTDTGRQIRKAFIPSDENHMILSADYSQIELRVLAHLSQDENLINSFVSGEDIHSRTASEVFGVALDQVTPEMRRNAKAVNFGIVYGISDFGLAKDLRIPREVAAEYIKSYFKRYPAVKEYLDRSVTRARELGYVTTIMNRRRYIPELTAKNRNIRQFGERIAMNTPIQGSAADIIKIAMVSVYKRLKVTKSNLILQVHDELIIDVCKDELHDIKKIVKYEMENAISLKAPLVADINYGANWYDAK